MEGFEKIDLDSTSQPKGRTLMKNLKGFKFFRQRKIVAAIIIILVLTVLSLVAVAIPGYKTYQDAKKTYAQVKLVEAAIKAQNITLADTELQKTRENLTQTQKDLSSMFVLGYIPVANWYYSDATHLVKAGFYGLDAANILLESVKPYADVLGLKGQGSLLEVPLRKESRQP